MSEFDFASERALLELARTKPAESDEVPKKAGSEAAVSATAETNTASSAKDPHRVGRYVILRRLGEGAMGIVYAAYDTDLDRKVAIKLVNNSRLGQIQGRSRVLREAQAMAQVSHPNVVHVYEVGESRFAHEDDGDEGQIFIAMEFVAGSNLYQWQNQGNRTFTETLQMYLQAGEGLGAAHRSGLIHRDFKPDNVLIGEDGRARVADFGLARTVRTDDLKISSQQILLDRKVAASQRLTEAGAIMGTPGYMSPEQYRGDDVDARSDQFSFCAALYEALYKQTPFEGGTFSQISEQVLDGKIRALPKNDFPSEVTNAIFRGLRVDPDARFPSMQALLDELKIGLTSIGDTVDTKKARRLFTWVFLFVAFAASIPAFIEKDPPPVKVMWGVSVFVFISVSVTTGIFYERLKHSEHLKLVFMVNFGLTQLMLARSVATVVDMSPNQYIAFDHVIMLGFTSICAFRWMPKLWLGCFLILVSGIFVLISPERFWRIPPAVYPSLGWMYALWWPKNINRGTPKKMPVR